MRHPDVARAASGYWHRRGLHTEPGQVVTAPGAPLLLLALLAATGAPSRGAGGRAGPGHGHGGVLLPRPSAGWHAPQARLLGRPVHAVPVPAECGGVPDPFALLESVRRARADGGDPRLLLLSIADDPTGTTAPPELLHEVCEAAVNEGLLLVSDESWRDTSHHPRDTVVVSPAEMLGADQADSVVVLAGLDDALLPHGLSAGIARFPASEYGRTLGDHVREVLATLHTGLHGPDAAAAAEALAEPGHVRERRAAGAVLHGAFAAALHQAFTAVGALCRPPQVGRHLYADLEQARPRLAAHGIEDAAALEAELVRRLGPYASGGHRLGDDPRALRVRLSTDVLATDVSVDALAVDGLAADTLPAHASSTRVPTDGARTTAPAARPLELPGVAEALETVRGTLADLVGADS